MNEATPAPGPGHNLPPEDQQLRDNIAERHRALKVRADELLLDGKAMPDVVKEDDIPRVTDFTQSLRLHMGDIDLSRKQEKSRFDRLAKLVDGVFHGWRTPLQDLHDRVKRRLDIALSAKAERVRAEKERDAELQRQAAKAEADRLEKERQRKQAEAEAAQRQAQEAERLRVQAAIDAAPKPAPTPPPAPADDAAAPASAQPRPMTPGERVAALEAERIANLQAKRASEVADTKAKELQTVSHQAERARASFAGASVKVQKVQQSKASEHAKTRGVYGAVATLQEFWDHGPIDRKAMFDHAPTRRIIWRLLSDDALVEAVKAHIGAAGGNKPDKLAGVEFFKNTRTQVR